jgi:glycogen debranching enzyme
MNLSDLLASTEALHLQEGKPLYAKLDAIRLENVPVMTRDRHIPRKEQAALARQLFKRLGLKGISVTAPRYSGAHSVDVRLPAEGKHNLNKWPHGNTWTAHGIDRNAATRCPACRDREAAKKKLEAILLAAFPNHDDRSDLQTDYYDFCWSIT